jgi:DNA repair exonuclease SbcCD ATPase subunit
MSGDRYEHAIRRANRWKRERAERLSDAVETALKFLEKLGVDTGRFDGLAATIDEIGKLPSRFEDRTQRFEAAAETLRQTVESPEGRIYEIEKRIDNNRSKLQALRSDFDQSGDNEDRSDGSSVESDAFSLLREYDAEIDSERGEAFLPVRDFASLLSVAPSHAHRLAMSEDGCTLVGDRVQVDLDTLESLL